MTQRKRQFVDINSDEDEDEDERTISESDEDEPSYKRQRLNNNNNHNHNRGHSNTNNGRQHPHYLKYASLITSISPYNASSLHPSASDDVMIIGSSSPNDKDVKIRKLRSEVRELKEKIKILRKITISSSYPEYKIITIDKDNGTIASKRIALLKRKMMDVYSKKTINVKINDTAHKKYTKGIKTFLKRNKNTINHTNNAKNPHIAVSMDDNQRYIWKKQRNVLKLIDYNEYDSDDETLRSVQDLTDENEAMSNVSVVCKHNIDISVVLGEYLGLQITIDELEDIYYRANQASLANLFAYELDLDLDAIDYDEDDDEDEVEEIKEVIQEIQSRKSKIVIDAVGYQQMADVNHLFMYIEPVEKEDDMNVSNIECVCAVINGWPRLFIVSKRHIKRGEALMGYFGEDFEIAKYQRLKDKRNRTRIAIYIDNILKMPLFIDPGREDIIR